MICNNNVRIFVFCLMILFFVVGCTGSLLNPRQRHAVFDEAEFAPYAGSGTSTIIGQAFMRTRGGDVKYGAGCEIYLQPVTSYTTEWFKFQVMRGSFMTKRDSRMDKYERITVADAQGNFEFKNLPAGDYYLATTIRWEYRPGSQTGGNAGVKVSVKSGEIVKAILTR